MRPDANHAHETNDPTRIWTYERIIKRYLRYTMIRCTFCTNDKATVQRIAFSALVTTCLLAQALKKRPHVRRLIDTMVDLAGNDTLPTRCAETPVFNLDAPVGALAGALNALPGPLREVSAWNHEVEPDVHALLVELAGCLDLPWAEEVGGAVLQYLTAWEHGDDNAGMSWTVN